MAASGSPDRRVWNLVFGLEGNVSPIVELASCIVVSERQQMLIKSDPNVRANLSCYPVSITAHTLKLAGLHCTTGWRKVGSVMRFIAAIVEETVLSAK